MIVQATPVEILGEKSSAQTYFEKLQSLFQESQTKLGSPFDRYYLIAGYVLRLRFSGPALLQRFSSAFDHLLISDEYEPDLTINLWEAGSSLRLSAPRPWSRYDYLPMGFIQGFNDERFVTIFQHESQVLNMLDRENKQAIFCSLDLDKIPVFENGHPLLPLLHAWLSGCQRQLIHAGAVGFRNGGVLISGKSGSGKSSTALSCLQSALSYAGDDFVAVHLSPQPFVYSVYNTGKIERDHLNHFPHLMPLVEKEENSNGKVVFYFHQGFKEKLIGGFPVKAIVFPKIAGGTSRLVRVTPAESLKILAVSTVALLPGFFDLSLKNLATLARKVPGYSLELGSDLSEVPALIEDLLRSDS